MVDKFVFKAFRIIRKSIITSTKKLDKLDEKLDKIIELLEEKE